MVFEKVLPEYKLCIYIIMFFCSNLRTYLHLGDRVKKNENNLTKIFLFLVIFSKVLMKKNQKTDKIARI